MIWTQLICSNSVIIRLNTKQLIAQHIPLLGYTTVSSFWELLDGFPEPFFKSVAVPIKDRRLCSCLATVEAPYLVEHCAACRCLCSQTADTRPWISDGWTPSFHSNNAVHLWLC
jgi:hypothetical protein